MRRLDTVGRYRAAAPACDPTTVLIGAAACAMAIETIFISHIAEEAELASLIKRQVVNDFLDGVQVFVSSDGGSISVGKRWLDEISAGLHASKVMLVLCSPLSVSRPWVGARASFIFPRLVSGPRAA